MENAERLARMEIQIDYLKIGMDTILDKIEANDARITRLERAWVWAAGAGAAVGVFFTRIKGLFP